MPITVDMTREDLLKAVRDTAGEAVAERMKAGEEKTKELDARIAALESAGSAGALKDAWEHGLRSGKPIMVDASQSVDGAIERGRCLFGRSRIVTLRGKEYVLQGSTDEVVQQGALFAMRMLRCFAVRFDERGSIDIEGSIDVARRWGDDHVAGALEDTRDHIRDLYGSDKTRKLEAQRALGTQILGSGAGFIAPQYAGFIVDFRFARTVVRQLVSRLPLSSGQLEIPYISDAATADFVGETTGVNASTPVEGRLNLVRKILQGVIAMSRELARESDYDIDEFYLRHLAKVMNRREDLALIRGDGLANTPRGMRAWIKDAGHDFNRTLDSGEPTVKTITNDALRMPQLIEDADVDLTPDGGAYIMNVETTYGLMRARNPTTEAEIWPEVRTGTFYGYRLQKTTAIPKNLAGDGGGVGTGNKSEVYFGMMPSFIVADTKGLEINVYDGGTYKGKDGNLRSGITNREVVITADQHFDFGALERGVEGALCESVDWGAEA